MRPQDNKLELNKENEVSKEMFNGIGPEINSVKTRPKPQDSSEPGSRRIHHPPIDFVDQSKIEAIISQAPDRRRSNLDELCNFFKNNVSNLCDEEKAWLVYRWIGENIDYDVEGRRAGLDIDVTAEGTFKNGKSVCSGYSRLYKKIAEELGIETVCISGYAKGTGYNPEVSFTSTNHEWNAVKLHGNWYLLDATWGAGCEMNNKYVRKHSQFYFCPDPNRFIRCHYPEDSKWQLLDRPISKNAFEPLLKYHGFFYDCGLLSTDPDTGVLKGSDSGMFTMKYDPNIDMQISGSLYLLRGNTYSEVSGGLFVQKFDDHFEMKVILNKKGKYKAQFFAKIGNVETYSSIFDYIINCDEDSREPKAFPETYEEFNATGAILHKPTMGPLNPGTLVEFKIQVKNVDVVMVKSKERVNLDKDGDIFTGTVEIGESEAAVYYKNAGMQQYSALLNYPVAN